MRYYLSNICTLGVWCRGITLPSHGRGPGFKSPLIQYFLLNKPELLLNYTFNFYICVILICN